MEKRTALRKGNMYAKGEPEGVLSRGDAGREPRSPKLSIVQIKHLEVELSKGRVVRVWVPSDITLAEVAVVHDRLRQASPGQCWEKVSVLEYLGKVTPIGAKVLCYLKRTFPDWCPSSVLRDDLSIGIHGLAPISASLLKLSATMGLAPPFIRYKRTQTRQYVKRYFWCWRLTFDFYAAWCNDAILAPRS